jgi:hypothetical protein
MLEDLAAHHQSTQQQRFQQHVTEILSDVSETDVSDSSQPSLFGSPISIDTPDIMVPQISPCTLSQIAPQLPQSVAQILMYQ